MGVHMMNRRGYLAIFGGIAPGYGRRMVPHWQGGLT